MATSPYPVLRYFARPYPWLLGGLCLATLVSSLLEALNLAAFFPVFHALLQGGDAAAQRGVLRAIASLVDVLPFRDPVVAAVVFLLAMTVLKSSAMLLREGLVAYTSGTVQHDIKNRLMECYARAPFLFFLDTKQGKLIYDVSVAAPRVGILGQKMAQLVSEVLKVAVLGGLLLVTLPLATAALAVVAFGYHRLTVYLSRKISYHTGKGRAVAGAEQTTIVNELLTGIRQIVAFGTQDTWLGRFAHHGRIFRSLFIKDAVWLAVPRGILELVALLVIVGAFLLSRATAGAALTADLALVGVFALGLLRILPSLTSLGQLRMEILSLMGDAEGVYRVLTETTPRRSGGRRVAPDLRTAIVLEDVSFGYPGKGLLLDRLNVAFEKGKVTAIVGPSGSGKTTIVNLLLGFLEPGQGRILVDGVELGEYRLESWRQRLGFVSQDPFVYHGTVADNITLGRSGRSRQAIERAAEIANAHAFVTQLPQGYDTPVGDRGMKLSGGEQQRLAIARAVLDEPEILVFDEATSSLDTLAEKVVQRAIETISRDRTVIIVAHRLSTVRYADKIIVLEQGRVVEEGTHHDLLGHQGRYFQLVASGER